MPEIGRDDREYWLKMLMGLSIEAHQLGEDLFEEEKLLDVDGTVRKAKMAVYRFECECNVRNTRLISSAALSVRQRTLMKLRYMKKRPWKAIYPQLDTTLRYMYEIHKNALQRVLRANAATDFKAVYQTEKARLDALNPYVTETE